MSDPAPQSKTPRAEPPALTTWPAVPRPGDRRRRVLVIEDYPAAADTLAVLLALHGHEVRVAHTGPDGVRVAGEWGPDAVLCDIGLPGLDGYAVARELSRTDGPAARPLLIAITAYGSDEDRRRAAEAGFDHHLTKPADPHAITRLLAPPGGSGPGVTAGRT